MDLIAKKLEFMERRLTLLEHEVARLTGSAKAEAVSSDPPEPVVRIACDEPGLLISRGYQVERDELGSKFVWVGNEGPIQIVLPVIPREQLTCHLFVWPHPQVDLSRLRLTINDLPCDHEVSIVENGVSRISAPVNSPGASKINIGMAGVTSVRPCDISDLADDRFLAFEFFGAEVVFGDATTEEGV